ncbi:MAG TPA: hypothetical protein VGS19_34260 [Streptosporangiaceae bacterium]|nr:hypothetical protein [Streptosporangiaceae bacterium]
MRLWRPSRTAQEGGRLRWWLWPDRNPLRRRTDRAEACIFAGMLMVFLVGAPMATYAAARSMYDSGMRTQLTEQETWHRVPAVLLAKVPALDCSPFPGGCSQQEAVRARWRAPDGAVRTGQVLAPAGMAAGSTIAVWSDADGAPTGPPLTHRLVVGQTILTIVTVPLLLVCVFWCAGAGAHDFAQRRRIAAWDADWRVTGPRWTARR